MSTDPAPTGTTLRLTRVELSLAYAVPAEHITELVNEGILEPSGSGPDDWHFNQLHWQRTGVAVRLQRDLGVNLPGVALALQLLEELEALRRQLHHPAPG